MRRRCKTRYEVNRVLLLLAGIALILGMPLSLHAASKARIPIPVVDGEAGPCSTELTVTGPEGAPIYAATVRVHIEYGLFGFHKLDLQVGTNTDGKARFEGLPDSAQGVFFFRASKGSRRGVAVQDPKDECPGQHRIIMAAPSGPTSKEDPSAGTPADD